MELAKILSDGTIDFRYCDYKEGARMTALREAGFLEFVASEQPNVEPGQRAVDSFTVIDGKVHQSWSVAIDTDVIEEKIEALKQNLSKTDYMVIKCYEAELVRETLPYDIETLHKKRQTIRDEINRLESMI